MTQSILVREMKSDNKTLSLIINPPKGDAGQSTPLGGKPSDALVFPVVYRSASVSYACFRSNQGASQHTTFLFPPGDLQLWIVFDGVMELFFDEGKGVLKFDESKCYLLRSINQVQGRIVAGQLLQGIVISVPADFLDKMQSDLGLHTSWHGLIRDYGHFSVYLSARPSEMMRQIVRNLAGDEFKGCFSKQLVEIKAMELIMLMLTQDIESSSKDVTDPTELDEKVQQMYVVRDILLESLADPPSIKKLALTVGTNESHLKSHFKEVFGQTVYGFLKDKRMEKALEMLRDRDLKIVEIAERLGYRHATHFSAAFKKHFGSLPKHYR